jgi:hypothetical protein
VVIGAMFFFVGAVVLMVFGYPWWLVALFVLGMLAGLWVEANA